MIQNVMLSITGRQEYEGQEPDSIELMTEGTLEKVEGGWRIGYVESELTGLDGVHTTFDITPGKIVLTRKGPLNSEMVFQEGVFNESLYQMEFGALMITVCAAKVAYDITEAGGTIDLTYAIDIEQNAAGFIIYHLDITPIK